MGKMNSKAEFRKAKCENQRLIHDTGCTIHDKERSILGDQSISQLGIRTSEYQRPNRNVVCAVLVR